MMKYLRFFTKQPAPQAASQAAPPRQQSTGEDNIKIILSLREQIELLEKRKEIIKSKQENITENAKIKAKNGDKKGAIVLLNQRKKNETELDSITSSQVLLENQLFTLESAAMNKETFDVLRVGNNAIKQINKGITADVIDEIMDDIQETQDTSQQIQNMLNAPLQTIYEDAELLAELAELNDASSNHSTSTSTFTSFIDLPSVPNTNPRVAVKVDEENDEIMTELRELEKGMLVN